MAFYLFDWYHTALCSLLCTFWSKGIVQDAAVKSGQFSIIISCLILLLLEFAIGFFECRRHLKKQLRPQNCWDFTSKWGVQSKSHDYWKAFELGTRRPRKFDSSGTQDRPFTLLWQNLMLRRSRRKVLLIRRGSSIRGNACLELW